MARSDTLSGARVWLAVLAVCLLLPGCGSLTRLNAVPAAAEERATVLGLPAARYWGDGDPMTFQQAMVASFRREAALLRTPGRQGALPPAEFLAISGGGENGAFGAGLLVGWTAAGTRPVFKGVTGISTGALTAPFAFLGPAYDDELQEVYTTISARDVLQPRGYIAALLQDALADNTPLRRTIGRYVDRNARLDPEWEQVQRRTFNILERAVSSLIQTQGVGDLYQIFVETERDGIDFNLAYIPDTFTTQLKEPFETEYMSELFQVGYGLAVDGYPWAKVPPGYTAPEVEPSLERQRAIR